MAEWARSLRWRVIVPSLVAVLAGWMVWWVFRPGIANVDGLWIYAQGLSGKFSDWQPPVAAVVVHWLLHLGVRFGHLTLLQSCLICFGIQRLAARLLLTLGGPALPADRAAVLGLGTLLLLLLPVSPLLWYLPYFGSDSWLLLALLLAGLLGLRAVERFPVAGPWERHLMAGGLVGLFTAAVLVRPNALPLAPVFLLALAGLHGRRRWRAAAVWSVALVAAWPAANAALHAAYPIERCHPEDQIMALDLVGVCVQDPKALDCLPYTRSKLIGERYKTRYHWGEVGPLFWWSGKPLVEQDYIQGGHAPLAAEYFREVRRAPGSLAAVKLKAFLAHLFEPSLFWHNVGINPNPHGLFQNAGGQRAREILRVIDERAFGDPVLRWVFARHLPWLVLNLIAVGGLGLMWRSRPNRRSAAVMVLLLVPLGYYASFLLASVALQYRYMYPATLLVQVFAVSVALAALRRKLADWARAMPA